MNLDKKGYFVILPSYEEQCIKVRHYTNKNKLKHTIIGETWEQVYKLIIENKLVSLKGHKEYLEEELKKVQNALENDYEYVQDSKPLKKLINKGAYCLIVKLAKDSEIKVGKLGTYFFEKGHYVYVGSAMNGLNQRIERHLKEKKKMHWHIDYLLKYAKIIDVLEIKNNKKLECFIASKVEQLSEGLVVGFGCSDCKCESHLFYFKKKPKVSDIYGSIV
jgi:Uri superfamily endonuclease